MKEEEEDQMFGFILRLWVQGSRAPPLYLPDARPPRKICPDASDAHAGAISCHRSVGVSVCANEMHHRKVP